MNIICKNCDRYHADDGTGICTRCTIGGLQDEIETLKGQRDKNNEREAIDQEIIRDLKDRVSILQGPVDLLHLRIKDLEIELAKSGRATTRKHTCMRNAENLLAISRCVMQSLVDASDDRRVAEAKVFVESLPVLNVWPQLLSALEGAPGPHGDQAP